MKFIRDNIVKILLVFGILIVLVIILIACSSGGTGVSNSSYSRMEDNLKNAAKKYLSNHTELLPKEEGRIVKVQMDTIYNEKQMKRMTAVDDNTVRCDGHVNVSFRVNTLDEKIYRVVPHIKCGDKYETEDLYKHILKNEELATELDGLYEIDDEYIYRGENPNNYVQIGENLYRIMSIDKDGYIKLIPYIKPYLTTVWDDRYNTDTKDYSGINDYYVSRIRTAMQDYYNDEDYFSTLERDVFVKHSYCIGKRSQNNVLINRTEECEQTSDEDYFSLPLLYDYYITSVDPNCKKITDQSCNNYNYLETYRSLYTPTGIKESTSIVYSIEESVEFTDTYRSRKVSFVLFMANVTYAGGKGTLENPYTIK